MTTQTKNDPFMEKYRNEFNYFCKLTGQIIGARDRFDEGEASAKEVNDLEDKMDLFLESVGQDFKQMFGEWTFGEKEYKAMKSEKYEPIKKEQLKEKNS